MVIHSLTRPRLTKIGIVVGTIAILGGVSLAIHSHNHQAQSIRQPAEALPALTTGVRMDESKSTSQEPVKIDQQHSEQVSGGGSVSSQSSSTIKHNEDGTNVSVSNNSSQTANSNGGSANVSNSTNTSVNITP